MAATAYAYLVSLLNTVDQIQIHPLLSTCFHNYQFLSLREKVDFLLDFVENHSDTVISEKVDFLVDADSTDAENLLSRIAVAAQKAEDIIEVEAADQIRDGSTEKSPSFSHNLQKIIQDMDSIIRDDVIKMKEERPSEDQLHSSSMVPPSSSTAKTATTMVGFGGYLEQVLDELTGYHSGRQVLPIVGMGGIGKTTLARNAYEHMLTLHHFDVRVWVTVSQTFSVRDILLQALSCVGGSTTTTDDQSTSNDDQSTSKTDDQLGQELRKILYCRRYLIVLDDVWSVEAWEKMQFCFPENFNGSRIVVTTRVQKLVNYFASSSLVVDFLDDKNSWDLFCQETFAQEGCPPGLEKVGKMIVKKCKGLPLAISVIGGLLCKSPKTQQYWKKISKDKSLVLKRSGEGNKALNILYLSYKHLPVCLKSCFLHLGLFPEDHQIDVSQVIQLWVAEGYIKANTNQSLEEVAESYIMELVERNLLVVGGLRLNKKLKTCCVHDLVRELCIKIAAKEHFYCVQRDIAGRRHFIVDERTARFYRRESLTCERPSVMRPLIFDGQREAPFKSRLLRVLVGDVFCVNPSYQEVNLRFFSHKYHSSSDAIRTYSLPSSISLCWCLQTLVLNMFCSVVVPSEIWKMLQLRHIVIDPVHLPHPPPGDAFVLQNLQTLKRVKNLSFSEEVCKRIPNIKELEIEYDLNEQGRARLCFNLHNVSCLNKLELLQYYNSGKGYVGDSMQNLKLPSSLKELVILNGRLVRTDMPMIASLPHLQILELNGKAVVGPEWNCAQETFISLKHLRIHCCNYLINWIADASHFPVLETLDLEGLSKLEEIPSGIGEIATLERIHVYDCSESATISAIKILEEQESLENQDLQLQLQFIDIKRAEMWREKIQQLGFTCQNLHISSLYLD